MAGENAIICSEQCGASYDLVKNSVNGYTFKNSDIEDLSNKINLVFKFRNRINNFKKNSLKLILKWNFERCYNGLNKAIYYVSKNN